MRGLKHFMRAYSAFHWKTCYLCCKMTIEKFLAYLKAEKRYSGHTVEAYARDISQFIEFTMMRGGVAPGDAHAYAVAFDPAAVTTDDIREWILDLSEHDASAATINRKTSSLRSYYRYMRKTGAVGIDPFIGVGFRKAPSRLPGFVPESTMENVLEALEAEFASDDYVSRRNALIILLFYSTGVRLAELHAIRLRDFSDDYSELRVTGKGGKERIVPVVEFTRRKIIAFLDNLKGLNLCFSSELSLFLTEEGKPVSRSEIYRVVRAELERAGVQGKRSPHVLRHTFATHMMDGGAGIREIQEMLGHSSLATTQVYTHNSIAKLKEAYRKAHPRAREQDADE